MLKDDRNERLGQTFEQAFRETMNTSSDEDLKVLGFALQEIATHELSDGEFQVLSRMLEIHHIFCAER